MGKILKPKVQATGLMDAFEMGVLKTLSERTLSPVVGNGTLMSGAAKIVGGGVISGVSKNKHVGLLSSAMVIDGVEDAAHNILGKILGATATSESSW